MPIIQQILDSLSTPLTLTQISLAIDKTTGVLSHPISFLLRENYIVKSPARPFLYTRLKVSYVKDAVINKPVTQGRVIDFNSPDLIAKQRAQSALNRKEKKYATNWVRRNEVTY